MDNETAKDTAPDQLCPCGSGKTYAECCRPFHDGESWPADPEQLVRARYSAYALGKWQYIVDTFSPRPGDPTPTARQLERQSEGVEWQELKILESGKCSEEEAAEAQAESYAVFYAFYIVDDELHRLGERSYFAVEDGKLFYVGGVPYVETPYRKASPKVGRNDPCPCGSGKKYKKCCGRNA